MSNSADLSFMRIALSLARRGLGRVAPNPAVGCVLVRPDLGAKGRIVGRGWTQPGGRPHAETEALLQAGNLAAGSTAYVTLEPCSHTGKTGPCADALINAGIDRCVIAMEDPDARVSGRGTQRLKDAEIAVDLGVLEPEARRLNVGFLTHQRHGRPWITIKLATTLDGAIATRSRQSKWITGPAARARGHLLRAQNDAIVTGIGTVLADDPDLTSRLGDLEERSPDRIVIDPKVRMPATTNLAKSCKTVHVVQMIDKAVTPSATDVAWGRATLPTNTDGKFSVSDIASELGRLGYTRVLVEAGQSITTAFFAADLVDEIAWFRAPAIMGSDGLSAIGGLSIARPMDMPRFQRIGSNPLDEDVLERYVRHDLGD